jgi:hypothetical protein
VVNAQISFQEIIARAKFQKFSGLKMATPGSI